MARIIPALSQFFDSSGEPLNGGKLWFFESGSSSTAKPTYADSGETVPNPNPVVLDADGRCPSVFGPGSYRVIMTDSAGVQILQRDPVGGTTGQEFGADWNVTTIYGLNDIVRDAGFYWESLSAENRNNKPSSDGGVNWTPWPPNVGDAELAASQAAASAAAAATSETNAATSETNAAASEAAAATSETNAAASEAAAAASEAAAATSETNAAASEAAAAASETNAAASEAAAATSETNAAASEAKAELWANELENVEVEPGLFSAFHWSEKAKISATGSLVYQGTWDASGGTYPSSPAPALGHYYKISVAGTISGTPYAVGDSIIYNGTGWDKIDNTEQVTSVAGKTGAVVLVKGDVGLGNVDNTSDADKPVSTAQQTALDAKLNLSGGTLTGPLVLKTASAGKSTEGNLGATPSLDLSVANFFTGTLDQAAAFTFANAPSNVAAFSLLLTNGGAFTITWPTSVDWPGGTAPDLTVSGVDLLTFITLDGGTTWNGMVSMGGLA